MAALEAVAKRIGAEGVQFDDRIAKVSIVGVGMRSHSGVAARMFSVLQAQRELSAMIKFSYAELDRRIQGLEIR